MLKNFERLIRFTDSEAWSVHCDKTIYTIIIQDERRPARIADFNLPADIQASEEDIRDNLISVTIYSDVPVEERHIDILDQFVKQVTDHVALALCDVVVTFQTGNASEAISRLTVFHTNEKSTEPSLSQLKHLNQDGW